MVAATRDSRGVVELWVMDSSSLRSWHRPKRLGFDGTKRRLSALSATALHVWAVVDGRPEVVHVAGPYGRKGRTKLDQVRFEGEHEPVYPMQWMSGTAFEPLMPPWTPANHAKQPRRVRAVAECVMMMRAREGSVWWAMPRGVAYGIIAMALGSGC